MGKPRHLFGAFNLFSLFLATVHADSTPFQASAQYDEAEFGVFPRIESVSRPDLYAPRVNILQTSPLCSTAHSKVREYTFLAPRGREATPSPIILDDEGELIWAGGDGHGVVYDLKPQRLFGQDVLTYWSGDDMVRGHGSGAYHILDDSYNEIHTYTAGNSLDGDLHEFLILENNTALLTIYHVESADLHSIGGPPEAEIWESIFQEIDLNTNEVIFEWHARDHYDFQDTYRTRGETEAGEIGDPFDWFHINSIAKDEDGNYLVSSRYTHSLTCIDGKSGEIMWILGGKRNDFLDLSGGSATTFAGQHDARWHENDTVITLFDNARDYDTHDAAYSRGVKLAVNQTAMTVELVAEYVSPSHILSESQGSMQVLSSGNALIGYGAVGAYTEFSADGTALCEVHFEAQSAFYNIDVMSYRVFKKSWKGFPRTTPDLVLQDQSLYVSWNGATEVRNWVVMAGADEEQVAQYKEMARIRKNGFETRIPLNSLKGHRGRYIRILGLDEQDSLLGASGVVALDEDLAWALEQAKDSASFFSESLSGQSGPVAGVMLCIAAVGFIGVIWVCKRRRQGDHAGYSLLPQRLV